MEGRFWAISMLRDWGMMVTVVMCWVIAEVELKEAEMALKG